MKKKTNKKTIIISEKQAKLLKNKIKKVRQGMIAYENIKPDYEIGFESPDANSYAHVVNESAGDLEYHYTNLKGIMGMMATDSLNLQNGNELNRLGKVHMSLTRMKSSAEGYGYGIVAYESPAFRIEFDGRKLNNIRNVKVQPYDYMYNNYEELYEPHEREENPRRTGRYYGGESAEAEDALYLKDGSDQVNDAIDYINRIDVLLKPELNDGRLFDKFWDYLEMYDDWTEKMHFYTNINDFNYRRNEISLEDMENMYYGEKEYAMVESKKHKTIVISESQAENLRKYLLLEDKRTKQAMNRARQVIRERFNNEPWLDEVFKHQDNPKGLTYLEYMLEQFIEQFYHNPQMRAGQTMRLMPLFCKLAFEFNFQNNNPDAQKLDRLRSILNHLFVISQRGKDLSKISLDTTFDELNNMYGSVIDAEVAAEKERMANTEYVKNEDYTIIGPVDFETAQKYGNESCPDSKLCYTQSEKTWNDYTNNGLNNAYIILKNGWENIPPQHDGDIRSPYDEYGLSMIFVFVNPFGELAYCNTRWNHEATYPDNAYTDKALSKEEISKIIGIHFDEVFKPNDSWVTKLSEVQERLANGESPDDVFDYAWPIGKGMYIINIGANYNYLTSDGQILRPDLWFNAIEEFDNGLALVNKNGLMNCIKLNGELISEEWFDYCGSWNEGWMVVTINKKYNFINQEGDFLFDEWIDGATDFRRGMSCINKNGNLLVIDRNGEIVKTYNSGLSCKQDEDGNLRVSFFNNFNLIDEAGAILSPNMWFRKIDEFHEGYAVVYINGKGYNYINTEGNVLSPDLWFDDTFEFRDGVGIVRLKDKGYNYINQDGEIIKPDLWFSRVYFFKDGFGLVEYEGVGCNYINNKGELLSPYLWFDNGEVFNRGYANVSVKEQDFYLKNDGKLYDKEGNTVNMSNLLHESVLKESPDNVETTNQDFDDVGACPFIMYKGFPEEVFIGPNGTTHDTLVNYIYEEVDEGYGDFYKISDELRDAFLTKKLKVALRDSFELEGRYWNNEWGQMISVWEYDTKNYKDLGRKLNYVIKQLKKEGWNVDVGTLDFDDWKGSQASRYPFTWLLNGMAEIYMPEAIQIKKQGENYIMYCKNGNIITINREGWVVKKPEYKMAEERKHKTIVISESQAKRLQKYLSEETNPEDVDLSSFKIQTKLHPKFWKNNKLDSKIRLKLLDIADDFVDSLDVDWVKPEDIIMTGSLANYTWSDEHSDIDLHVLMDFKEVDEKVEFVKNYFKVKKDEWIEKHQELKIMGFPIEVYVQDVNEKHAASGIYSLEKNEWVKKPNRKNFSDDDYEDDVVKETVSDYMNQIDDVIEKFEKTNDNHQIEGIYDEANEIFDNIKNERLNAFKKTTKELSTGNVIFKTLRRNGYIEKIIDLKNKSYDKINSLS